MTGGKILYRVNFTTNEGDDNGTDAGTVIYSAQATRRARADTREETYCNRRGGDYKSCMFSDVSTCYSHARISAGPTYRRIDWAARLGYGSRISQVPLSERDPDNRNEVISLCDPKPPGANEE